MTRSKILSFALALMMIGAANFAHSSSPAHAAGIEARDGWVVVATDHSFADLVSRVEVAASDNKIGIVTRASATIGAKRVLDFDIPGNMVMGLYHPRFAVRMLEASVAAGIEAPIRIYLTENEDGTATISYKMPSHVFAPYRDEGGAELTALASELDELFASLVAQAAGND